MLAFVHSAFWRGDEGGEEGYIGAVLEALDRRADALPLRLVGVGPRRNFRAHRWWHGLTASERMSVPRSPVVSIESLAPLRALRESAAVWRARRRIARALHGSEDLRRRAQVLGIDVWPIVARELTGIAELQFPWSARSMDEAAAALEAYRPAVAITYAEAGGWGRALMLEARRRGIAAVGIQHGFIYRHWLNYLHERDEMQPSPNNDADRGFPSPSLTLLYDGFAREHLVNRGHFHEDALRVTGSPALDRLVASAARTRPGDRLRIRKQLGVQDGEHLVLIVSKHSQIGRYLPALVEALLRLPATRLIVKPHPAETADPYLRLAREASQVIVAGSDLDLSGLLAVARTVVTVNSTVAVDALSLGIPALSVGLPNNLSPLVEQGAIAGAGDGEVGDALVRTVADESFRTQLLAEARAFTARYAIQADGRAAERAADAIASLLTRD